MKIIYINKKITLTRLSEILNINLSELLKIFFENSLFLNKNSLLSFEFVKNICKQLFNINVINKNNILPIFNNKLKKKRHNTIFVSIIGNVNNGKTTLLDFIFKIKKVNIEYGKITQDVYVNYIKFLKKKIFFFDLPGHKLFNNVVNNIINIIDVVLIILNYNEKISLDIKKKIIKLKKKNIGIIICINKIDQNKNLNKYFYFDKEEILISAKIGFNIKNLITKIINLYNLNKKYFNFNYPGFGIIISTKIINKVIFTKLFLIKGILKINNFLFFKETSIKIENMFINTNEIKFCFSPNIIILKKIQIPIEDFFFIYKKNTNDNLLYKNYKEKYFNLENFYIKTDNYTIALSFINFYNNLKLNEKINIEKIIIGDFNETDLNYCLNFNCKIILINVNIKDDLKKKIIINNLFIKNFNLLNDLILYFKTKYFFNLIEIKKSTSIIKNIFPSSKNKKIAGCVLIKGEIFIKDTIKIYKNLKLLFKGEIESIKIDNKNVNKINNNKEFGIIIKNFNDIEIGLKINSYEYKNE
ncbi:putative translation initiation factor IF-2 [Candidatus Carsonella ruddii CS isolate Thao2000]|uniref:Putative translation initiation factor IF-2 n=1 Tax=Candidatus Carsonella ruddii CS isolate Thao2000 TaxID=1202537 RepID=J7GSL0_CARRU|nr:GTP-binding protein [Candidatus Carsonella ruddii]AFP83742.1 putative translation initiation factor IF-2 [Candidatus Carsonella ruddii CS isolate Thao2000]